MGSKMDVLTFAVLYHFPSQTSARCIRDRRLSTSQLGIRPSRLEHQASQLIDVNIKRAAKNDFTHIGIIKGGVEYCSRVNSLSQSR